MLHMGQGKDVDRSGVGVQSHSGAESVFAVALMPLASSFECSFSAISSDSADKDPAASPSD
jgi:hypothetical protein